MALIQCSECGKQISDKAAACPVEIRWSRPTLLAKNRALIARRAACELPLL